MLTDNFFSGSFRNKHFVKLLSSYGLYVFVVREALRNVTSQCNIDSNYPLVMFCLHLVLIISLWVCCARRFLNLYVSK